MGRIIRILLLVFVNCPFKWTSIAYRVFNFSLWFFICLCYVKNVIKLLYQIFVMWFTFSYFQLQKQLSLFYSSDGQKKFNLIVKECKEWRKRDKGWVGCRVVVECNEIYCNMIVDHNRKQANTNRWKLNFIELWFTNWLNFIAM